MSRLVANAAAVPARELLRVEVAFDRRTGFPCLRGLDGSWLHLLPVTKLQVEQWVAEGGCRHLADARQVTGMIRRLEEPAAGGHHPPTAAAARRRPLGGLGPRDPHSVLATNLSVWSRQEQLEAPSPPSFPTLDSEWGRFAAWLGADVPPAAQLDAARRRLQQVATRELLRQVVRALPPGGPRVARRLLEALAEAFDPQRRGLPFADSGVWELVREHAEDGRVSQGGRPVLVYHPVAVGRTPLWPSLPTQERHVLLHPELPMVGLRPCPREVTGERRLEVRLAPQARAAADPRPAAGSPRRPAVHGATTMSRRCPLCYQQVGADVWGTRGHIWCAEVRVQEGDRTRVERVHTPARPRDMTQRHWVEVSAELVSADYRAVAERRPGLVRPVCVSGYTQQGKTCFLLSLTGTLFYPQGDDAFSRLFPADLELRRMPGALARLDAAGRLNLYRSLEEMWIDGVLPPPTPIERALATPMIFSAGRPGWLRRLLGLRRELVVLINDVAGEAVGPELALNPAFPHVACSRDVIYVLRACELSAGYFQFEQFAAGLGHGLFEGRRVDRRQLNLIIAVSQLDRLGPDGEADPELLRLCTRPPSALPGSGDEAEFAAYLRGMARVHEELRGYLLRRLPNLVRFAEEAFGSVRYCGFSAFGHHPLPRELAPRPDCNGCLVAAPRPVRVVDPLLWILWDQGLFTL